jgi:hypothetical protein
MRVNKLFEAKGIQLPNGEGYEGTVKLMSRIDLRAHRDDETIEIKGDDIEELIENLSEALFTFFVTQTGDVG